MAVEEVQDALALAVFCLALVSIATGVVCFIAFRNVSPIRNRDLTFSLLLAAGMLAVTFQTLSNFIDFGPCLVTFIVWKSLFPNPVMVYAVRCLRLYMRYRYQLKLHETYLDTTSSGTESQTDDDDNVLKAQFDTAKRFDTVFLIKVYAPLHGIQVLIALISIIYTAASGDPMENACKNSITTVGAVYTFLVFLGALLIFTVKLWEVRDAYFIKKEFKALAIFSLAVGLPSYVLTFFDSLKLWGFLLIMVVYLVLMDISLLVPAARAYQNAFLRKKDKSDSVGFEDREDIKKVTADKHGRRALEAYRVSLQSSQVTYMQIFMQQIEKYKELDNGRAVGHAYLMKQKFLDEGAYLYLRQIPTDKRTLVIKKIEEVAEASSDSEDEGKGAASTLPKDLFDELEEFTKKWLMDHFYTPFFQSEDYHQWQQKSMLKDII